MVNPLAYPCLFDTNSIIGDLIVKKTSIDIVSRTIAAKRKEKKLTQGQLSELSGINRCMIGRA